jgi:hypothetical protein
MIILAQNLPKGEIVEDFRVLASFGKISLIP